MEHYNANPETYVQSIAHTEWMSLLYTPEEIVRRWVLPNQERAIYQFADHRCLACFDYVCIPAMSNPCQSSSSAYTLALALDEALDTATRQWMWLPSETHALALWHQWTNPSLHA